MRRGQQVPQNGHCQPTRATSTAAELTLLSSKTLFGGPAQARVRCVDKWLRRSCGLGGVGEHAGKPGHVGWQWTGKAQALAGNWVLEAQFSRVQGLSLESLQCDLGPKT